MQLRHILLWAVGPAAVASKGNKKCQQNYDYVIVGGGTSGLVVANRLSENKKRTVLVIERGGFANGPRATVPYWSNDLDTSVMIRPTSAPIPALNNATVNVAVAAVVGGATVVNGMAYMRGSRADYDAWEELGNPGWGWGGLMPYFRKSTTFTPPSPEVAAHWNITWDPSVFGSGPLQATIPNFHYPDLANFWASWRNEDDVPMPGDVNSGAGPGAYWGVSTLDARDSTRCSARDAYYDPVYEKRSNLHLLTGHTVTEIVFDKLHAVGVKMTSEDGTVQTACAKKEVILAAGAVHTPHLLQVSGIGPQSVLESAGIRVKLDLPAVGANLQDHPASIMLHTLENQSFPNPDSIGNNATYNATVWEEYYESRTGPIASGSSGMVATLSLQHVASNFRSIINKIKGQNPREYLPDAYSSDALLRGFKEQRKILLKQFSSKNTAMASFPFRGNGLGPAVFLKPLSRGTITLDPENPSGLPVVHYNTLMNPVDIDMVLSIVKRARRAWASDDLEVFNPQEILPGAQHHTDEAILGALKGGALLPTLAHMSGTCAMMPKKLGGCVGSDLRVYGVKGLSVVDASVMPMIVSGTTMGTVYAVAEKAADLIKARA